MNIRCRLFGCREDYVDPMCRRCGKYIYDYEYQQSGLLSPIVDRLTALGLWCKAWLFPDKCEVCGKRLKRGEKYIHAECYGKWIPF